MNDIWEILQPAWKQNDLFPMDMLNLCAVSDSGMGSIRSRGPQGSRFICVRVRKGMKPSPWSEWNWLTASRPRGDERFLRAALSPSELPYTMLASTNAVIAFSCSRWPSGTVQLGAERKNGMQLWVPVRGSERGIWTWRRRNRCLECVRSSICFQ